MKMSPVKTLKYFKYWPPFLFSGISVKDFDLDIGYVVSQLKLSSWNSNAYRTQYGGSLFSMCDPFYLFILSHKLGSDYYIWDIESNIKFVKSTKQTVTAEFRITDEQIEDIRKKAANGDKVTPNYKAQIMDTDGALIAEVSKTLYVKLKPSKRLAKRI